MNFNYITFVILFLFSCHFPVLAQQKSPARVPQMNHPGTYFTGRLINSPVPIDTVYLDVLSEFGSGNGTVKPERRYVAGAKNHQFSIRLPDRTAPFYISIITNVRDNAGHTTLLVYQNFIVPGDSVHLSFDYKTKQAHYSGRGAEKFNFMAAYLKRDTHLLDSLPHPAIDQRPVLYYDNLEFLLRDGLELLESYRAQLDSKAYLQLKADLIGGHRSAQYELMHLINFGQSYPPPVARQVDSLFHSRFLQMPGESIDSAILKQSVYYGLYLMMKGRSINEYLASHQQYRDQNELDVYQRDCSGPLLDKTVITRIYHELAFNRLSDSMIQRALTIVRDPDYHQLIADIQKARGGNAAVTGFNFPDKDGKMMTLGAFKGKVIFLDMWFTGCEGCINVAQQLPKVEEALKGDTNVVFLSLSIDKNKSKWLKSIDPNTKINNAYTHFTTGGTKYFYTDGTGGQNEFVKRYNTTQSYPCIMVIGKNGKLYTANPPVPSNPSAALKTIEMLKKALAD